MERLKERLLLEEVKGLRSNSFYDNGSPATSRGGSKTSQDAAKDVLPNITLDFHGPSTQSPRPAKARYSRFMKSLRMWFLRTFWAAMLTFNWHTLLLCGLSCLAVNIAQRLNIAFDVPFSIVTFGTIFPSVFTIGLAFTRREQAAAAVSLLRADFHMLYTSYWMEDVHKQRFGKEQSSKAVGDAILAYVKVLQAFLGAPSRYENLAEWMHFSHVVDGRDRMSLARMAVLAQRSKITSQQYKLLQGKDRLLSDCQRKLMKLQLVCQHLNSASSSGGYLKAGDVLHSIRLAFENLRVHRDYRTPVMMRHAQSVLLHVLCIALAPYFSSFCISWKNYGNNEHNCPAGYSAAIIYNVIVMLMFKIQSALEYALDMNGFDDLFFDLVSDVKTMFCDAADVVEEEGISKHMTSHALADADRDLLISYVRTPCFSDHDEADTSQREPSQTQFLLSRSGTAFGNGAASSVHDDDDGHSSVIVNMQSFC